MLKESEDEIKVFALQRLNELVDDFWAEISEDVSKMCVANRVNLIPKVFDAVYCLVLEKKSRKNWENL